jgi:predicted NBD/HSP70 family sugar kinase
MLGGIADQVAWLNDQGDLSAIGLGTPGLINPRTGVLMTANLPATGRPLADDIANLVGQDIPVIQDCRAFSLSEATLGAGRGYRNVVGLIIGTGVAGGHVIDGQIPPDLNGQHGEYGHLALPADLVVARGLPLLPCGCGMIGCFETYLAGPGLVRLAEHMTGQVRTAPDIWANMPAVKIAWLDIASALLAIIARTADPDVIVLGGGLGMAAGMPDDLTAALDAKLLADTQAPRIVQASFGDASGAVGAAIYAQQKMNGETA